MANLKFGRGNSLPGDNLKKRPVVVPFPVDLSTKVVTKEPPPTKKTER